MPWQELEQVDIVTTDKGPFEEDVFFVLRTVNGEACTIPHGLAVQQHLLDYLQRLPGFEFKSNEVVAEAMGSAENRLFVCWQRPKE